MKYVGIDPGLYGAIALYDPDCDALTVWDVPTFSVGKGRTEGGALKRKAVIDEVGLATIFDGIAKAGATDVWLEKVGSRPGEGHVGAFGFGRTYGLLRGLCVAHFWGIHDVTPAHWKASHKVSGDKDQARMRASQIMPKHAHNWPLKKHDGRAEAALIAKFGHLSPRI